MSEVERAAALGARAMQAQETLEKAAKSILAGRFREGEKLVDKAVETLVDANVARQVVISEKELDRLRDAEAMLRAACETARHELSEGYVVQAERTLKEGLKSLEEVK